MLTQYSNLLLFFLICVGLAAVLVLLSLALQSRSPDREKNSVYECGFNPFQSPGQPFSMSFFLIALLFLVFDLEMSFLFPWCKTLFQTTTASWLALFFLILLTWGLVYEWLKGALEWE